MPELTSFPLELNKMFTRASVKVIHTIGNPSTEVKPPSGKHWLLINGGVKHVTGTASVFLIRIGSFAQGNTVLMQSIASAIATGFKPLFNRSATTPEETSLISTYIINDGMTFYFAGGAASYIDIQVLEW